MKNERLIGKQKNIDVAPPKGKITAADFKKLRAKKNEATDWRYSVKTKPVDVMSLRSGDDIDGVGTVTRVAKDEEGRYHVFVTDSFGREKEYRNGFSPFNKVNVITTYIKSTGPRSPRITEGGDHEVAMAMSSLKEIVEAAQELMSKLGGQERNIPGWIQNHITNAQNYIVQASQGFHELTDKEEDEDKEISLLNMVEEIQKSKEQDKIISKSDLSKKLRELSVEILKTQGIDTKEANNLYQLLKNMIDKSQKGSIGTNIDKTSQMFIKSTKGLDKS